MTRNWPVVRVVTTDGYTLHGLYAPVAGAERTLLHIHGTGGSLFWNDFYPTIAQSVNVGGLSYLTTNNRGSGVYELEQGAPSAGVSLEIFDDSLQDIDAWIEFALAQGSKEVVLEGHSFGIGKASYYMAEGKYRDKIKGVVFLGTNGVYQTQTKYLTDHKIVPEKYLKEAKELVDQGKPTALLTDPTALCGYYPASAQTYLNFFTPGSGVFKATQMATAEEGGYRSSIKVPLLWILGDQTQNEYLFVPFEEAFELVRRENPQVEIHQLKDCDHGLHDHEAEVAKIVADFVKSLDS